MTAQYIAFHAAERPDAVAIVNNGREISFAQFSQTIGKFTRALRAFGLPRAASVVIDCDDAYFNWVMRLAFEQLGVVTSAVTLRTTSRPLKSLREFDLVLAAKALPAGTARRQHATTHEWLRRVDEGADAPEEPPPVKAPDDPIGLMLTSGTTGPPKRLVNTRKTHEAWIERTAWIAGFTPQSRYLLMLPLAYAGPTGCIRAGGVVVIENRMSVSAAIAVHRVTHTTLPPILLKHVVDELPADYSKPADLTIISYGAAVSHSLREKVMKRLASRLFDIYGSSEGGYISSRSVASEVGTIWPGVRVEVVDDNDRPLPFGEIGHIRVQTDYMKGDYPDRPRTAGQFKDGWFYANDVGILHDSRRLQVLGRSDDLLNIGWRKFAPDALEELVRPAVQADDLAVCSVSNSDGVEEVCVAVVNPRDDDAELLRRVADVFRSFQLGRTNIFKAISIPRTANGKIQRQRLKESVARARRIATTGPGIS